MHPEIEKLIDLALADGQITEKERNVILKKVAELGVDADEVEMTLDGRLHQMQATQTKPSKEKVGNIKTCPACGASVKAMELGCSECGHEFTNSNSNSTIKNLEQKIEAERSKYLKKNSEAGQDWYFGSIFNEEELPRIIKNYPIPNTKEDLFEALSFMSSKVISSTATENEEINAYQAKALEIITKLYFIPNIDSHLLERVKEIENKMKKVKNKNVRNLWLLMTFVSLFLYFIIAKLFGWNFWPFK